MSEESRAPIGAMTVPDFLRQYGVGRTKLYEEIAAGRIVARRCGRRTLIRVADAEAWLAALQPACTA